MNIKACFATLALTLVAQGAALAVNIPLPNTGGGAQVGGTLDPVWTYQNALGTGPAQVLSDSLANWYPQWLANDAGSSWIGVSATDTASNPPPLVFTASFSLAPYILSSVSISGSWAVDDSGILLANGNFVSNLTFGQWGQLTPFAIANNLLQPGRNVLTVVVYDNDNFLEGMRLNAVGTGTLAPIPEPGTWAMMLGGLALFAGIAARRKAAFKR